MAQTDHESLLGDCRRVLQVSGAGEKNKLRREHALLNEDKTKFLSNNIRSLHGEFNDENSSNDCCKAVTEFYLPFLPWTVKYIKGSLSSAARLKKSRIRFKKEKCTLKNVPKSNNKFPSATVVTHLRDLGTVIGVVNCWRKGTIPYQGLFKPDTIYPLCKLITAKEHQILWEDASDNW